MDRLFPLVSSLLSSSGCFYLVTVAENKPGMVFFKLFFSEDEYPTQWNLFSGLGVIGVTNQWACSFTTTGNPH